MKSLNYYVQPTPGFRRLIATTLFLSTAIGHALPTAVESFLTGGSNYAVGTGNLIPQGPPATGFVGTWQTGFGQSPDVIATGLTYSTVPNAGGAIEYPAASGGRVGRLLTNPYGNSTSGTVYYGVMIQLSGATGEGYRGLELHTGSFSDDGANRRLQIVAGGGGTGAPTNHFGVRVNGNGAVGFIGDLGLIDTNVNFFIVKVSFSATVGQDVVSIWRNPTNLSSEAGSGTAGFTSVPLDFAFDRVSFACFSPTGYQADELRIGNAWTDVTTPVNNADTDGDGLPDTYEQVLIDFSPTDAVDDLSDIKGPLNAPATSDFDNDGSSDAQEFARATNPNKTDTDNDGLLDGPETDTNTFVSASNTGSDPLDNDSDNDTLKDGPEVTLYGTDPNVADTDGDGANDGLEVAQGSNPADATSNASSLGIATVDGFRETSLYSTPLAVQTVNTEFGDNFSEWNAAYAYVNGGKLYLIFTGNLQNNFNKLEIFIDSKAGGSSTFTSAGNDGAGVMDGMKFDSTFAPDYHLIARRGAGILDLDFANLATLTFTYHQNVFNGSDSGSGFTGTGINTRPIQVGYDGTNAGGIVGGTGAADQLAASEVATGLELAIDLADLGNPTGAFKVMLLQSNDSHNFVSNQSLGGLPAGFGNLGDPANTKDFSTYAGDQFFAVDPNAVHLLAGGTALRFIAKGLTPGAQYIVQESTTLVGFTDVPNSGFTATGTVQVTTISVAPGTEPKRFFRVRRLP